MLSPPLSLTGRDPMHSAVADRHFIHEAPTEQLVEKWTTKAIHAKI